MKKGKIDIEGEKLRGKAEELLRRNPKENAKPISESEALKLVHELEVHQIELELQNKELIEAEEAAQIATEKYVELYDFALFGFFTLSKEGEILALNFNGAKMLGKNRSELVNRRLLLFVSDDSKPIFNSFCDTIISSKAKQSCEVELQNNSSSPTHLHLSGIIKENDDQLFVMALDITSRKLAEIEQIKAKAKAEESEQKYRALYENAPLPYQSLNEDGSFKDVSPAWLSTLGYKREEVIGKFYKDFLHPDWQSHFENNFPAFKKRGYVSDVHFKIRHKKGHYIDISFEGCIGYHPDGSFKQTYCVFQDITYKKQAENALVEAKEKAEESEAKFRELFSNVNDAVFMYNPDTFEILEANEATSELYGYSHDELIGMSCLKFSAEIEKSKSVAKLIKNERKVTVKLRHHKKKDGTDVFVELSNYNISVNEKNIIYSVCHDITEIKKTELELITAKEKAKESERQLKLIADNFVNGMIYQVAMLDENRRQFNYISKNVKELYGCTVKEAKEDANLIYGKLHPDDINGLIEKEKEALRNMSAFETEARAITPDGNIRWAYYISKPRVINGIVCWDGIEVDITERKQMELELRKAKEKAEESEKKLADSLIDLQLAQTIASIGNWQFEPEIGIPIWSDEIYSIYERNKELGPPHIVEYKKMYSEEQYNIFSRAFNAALSEGMDYDIVLKFNSPDNREKWIRAICQPDTTKKSNKGYFLRGTIQDITELKKTELELVKAKEKAEESEIEQRMQNQEIELNSERLESLLRISQLHTDSIQELLDFALNEAINLTYSKIGYIYFYSEDTKQFSLNPWSKEVVKECMVMNPQTIYELDDTGCWGEAVRQRKPIVINDYQAENPLKKGTPHGHVKLSKFLTVPVIFDDKIVAVAGVANKASDYDDSDIRQLTLLMDNVWKISERIILIENLRIAQKETEESEQRLKLAINSGELGIWDWDLIDNSMIWDERMFELYGIKQNTFSKNIDAWVNGLHPEDKDRAIAESNEALAGGKEFDTTFRVLHPNGAVKYLKADAVVIRDDSGKAIRMIGINKDVTESILAEQSLKISEANLKELNATKDKLFSIIGHDLRSPFNSILGLSELISENIEKSNIEELKSYSDNINSSARNTLVLLDNLLNWAKSQTGKLNSKPEKIMLSKVILEIIQLKKLRAKSKNISLNYSPSDEFEVFSDENMLKLVFRNLISNAIKFTKPGGNINISVISAQNHVEISVSDNGVGMSDETRKKLFDIATNTTSRGTADEKGSGLGLVLCKEFVKKLGGDIWVESEEGVGSQFYFTIPFERINKPIETDRLSETI